MTMPTAPEHDALRLADELESMVAFAEAKKMLADAAAELRRLHALAQKGGWVSVDERLPACDGETMFIGENDAGYIACFNLLTDDGYCFHNDAETSICVMSGLRVWKRVDRPLPPSPAAEAPAEREVG